MSTSSPPKSDTSQPNRTAAPDFASWQTTNLVNFAHDAYAKMQEQADQIMQLQQDLKTAMEAYRSLLRQK
jgi:hypothetical protein